MSSINDTHDINLQINNKGEAIITIYCKTTKTIYSLPFNEFDDGKITLCECGQKIRSASSYCKEMSSYLQKFKEYLSNFNQ